ncbi:MAG: tetratricopeptide repeat protein [Acidobacteria bacterium]|nr:tetratricopeptide repeat protein [Acidobacteriota bacterium]
MIYLLFFLSGLSGLVYQVVWVRVFGNVFGNTVYSASIVIAVFMLGLGVGSYVVGAWADRRYMHHPDSLLRAYGSVEIAIASLGFAVAAALPHLGAVSALVSSYVREPSGWYVLSTGSYLARAGSAIALLTPITLLMGGTLTLLIRHLVRSDLAIGGWRIAELYGINTLGAATGAVLTDFALVPAWGLWSTQMIAVGFNVVAGVGAWYLASHRSKVKSHKSKVRGVRLHPSAGARGALSGVEGQPDPQLPDQPSAHGGGAGAVVLTSMALAMSGLAALGMEILWFRHFTILLGGFRAVFSLLLTLILLGIGLGALVGGAVHRRTGRPAEWLMLAQGLLVASTLFGFAAADVEPINTEVVTGTGTLAELWFNAKPMLQEVALPALLMGCAFPLANALIQRAEARVGRRAGVLYLANTAGAVAGSLAAGFLLLPAAGLQLSTTILMTIAAAAIVPLFLACRSIHGPQTTPNAQLLNSQERGGWRLGSWSLASASWIFAVSLAIAASALGLWLRLPSDHVTMRALGAPRNDERRLVVSDGLTELIAVAEAPGRGRTLYTNGHAMSSTLPLSQRYMRALAHLPLLSMDRPEDVLVIGFGVGNTTHAATLHPSVRRVELADLSRDILAHAPYFEDATRGVLADPKVAVHINDGRQHLLMRPPAAYDLVVLEPPPIAYAGVGALYSREFYELARGRLKPNGSVSQWLPAYQVPPETTLSMVRAFVDVFPAAVLLSGSGSDLLLVGTTADRIAIDPDRVAGALGAAPAVRADLERVSLGTLSEIVATFVGSARTLDEATRGVPPVVDDRPLQEYGVRSMLNAGHGVPAGIVDLSRVAEWCPRCFDAGRPVPALASLDLYFRLLALAYDASPAEVAQARRLADTKRRAVAGSAYLGAIIPESAGTHNVLGLALAERGALDQAIAEFRRALDLDPNDAPGHWHLGAALAELGVPAEATTHLLRAVELDPRNGQAHGDLGFMLAAQGKFEEAEDHLQQALALDPGSEDVRRTLDALRERRRQTRAP